MQAEAGTGSPLPVASGAVSERVRGDVLPDSGCREAEASDDAHVDLPPTTAGSQVLVRSSGDSVRVAMVAPSGRRSTVRKLTTVPGETVGVSTLSREFTLRLLLPPGPVTFCAPG